jgi:hypothetical protein
MVGVVEMTPFDAEKEARSMPRRRSPLDSRMMASWRWKFANLTVQLSLAKRVEAAVAWTAAAERFRVLPAQRLSSQQ